jgi:hypothetical protein
MYTTMSPEFEQHPPDELEVRLLARADAITTWVENRLQRRSHDDTTQRKLTDKLATMTEEFRDTAAYIQSPLVLMPMEDGSLGVGSGETTGELVGFSYDRFPTLRGDQAGPQRSGVIAIVATGGTNIEGVTHASWNRVIPAAARAAMGASDDYTTKGVIPILVPIVEGTHFTQIDNAVPLYSNLSSLIKPEVLSPPAYSYQDYVDKIERLMRGRLTLHPEMDKPLFAALAKEVQAMNYTCPFLGQPVRISAEYMRTPSQKTTDGFTVIRGSAHGVLSKFIYEPYFPSSSHPHLQARGTMQAVVYQPDVARQVYAGRLSANDADKMFGTLFVPLDQTHELSPI